MSANAKQLRMDEFTTFKEMYTFATEMLQERNPNPTDAEVFDCMRTILAFADWRMKYLRIGEKPQTKV